MKIMKVVAPTMFLFTIMSSAQEKPAASHKPQLAELYVDNGVASAKGVWRSDIPAKDQKNKEDIDEVSQLSCFDEGGETLVRTKAFCIEATATRINDIVDANFNFLKVIRWDDAEIIAADDQPICLTSQTIFDLKRKTVIALSIRKPEAHGALNSCDSIPDRETFYLQSVIDYFGQKAAKAK
jgi:hypothetical protein